MRAYDKKQIKIIGYKGEVQNTFYQQKNKAGKVAIMFPGVGYTCQMPLIYYPTLLLLELGFDVLWVETNYGKNNEFMALNDPGKWKWIRADAIAAYRSAIKGGYNEIALVGKSLGSASLAALASDKSLTAPAFIIWLTPPVTDVELRGLMGESSGGKHLLIIGTADPGYDSSRLEETKNATNGRTLVIEGANHSMEIDGDVDASIAALRKVLETIRDLIGSERRTKKKRNG